MAGRTKRERERYFEMEEKTVVLRYLLTNCNIMRRSLQYYVLQETRHAVVVPKEARFHHVVDRRQEARSKRHRSKSRNPGAPGDIHRPELMVKYSASSINEHAVKRTQSVSSANR